MKVGDKVSFNGMACTVVALRGSMHVDLQIDGRTDEDSLLCDVSINDEGLAQEAVDCVAEAAAPVELITHPYLVTLKFDGRKTTVVTHATSTAHAQELTLGYFEYQGVPHGEVVRIVKG